MRVIYCPQKEGQPVEHDIGLQTTCPYRGGVRWWFMCPLQRNGRPCGRRVQMLYLPPNGRQFGCHHCHHLWYESQRRDERQRPMGKVHRIRERLGGNAVLGAAFPEKPPRMRQGTFERIRRQAQEAETKARNSKAPLRLI